MNAGSIPDLDACAVSTGLGADVAGVVDEVATATSGPIRVAHPDVAVSFPEMLPGLTAMLTQGRRIRGLYDAESVHTRSLEIGRWAAAGEEQRLASSISTEFVCFGDEAALLSRSWGDYGPYTVIREPSVIASLVTWFDRMWETAVSVEGTVDTESDQLIDLLAQGLRDEAIAKAMGVSVRVIRKRIDALMRACGAQTRFGLAVALAERGMLNRNQADQKSGWPSR